MSRSPVAVTAVAFAKEIVARTFSLTSPLLSQRSMPSLAG
jgi:hypothetical protein